MEKPTSAKFMEQDMILPSFGVCLNCMVGVPEEDKSMMLKAMTLKMLKDATSAGQIGPRYLKVEFFESASLDLLKEKINTFFEEQRLERIQEIKFDKEIGRYTVMVVYV